jgi:hypothetical protein
MEQELHREIIPMSIMQLGLELEEAQQLREEMAELLFQITHLHLYSPKMDLLQFQQE